MSVADELARIENGRYRATQALQRKGVDIDDDLSIDFFEDAIDSIEPPSNYGLVTYTAADPTAAEIKIS